MGAPGVEHCTDMHCTALPADVGNIQIYIFHDMKHLVCTSLYQQTLSLTQKLHPFQKGVEHGLDSGRCAKYLPVTLQRPTN